MAENKEDYDVLGEAEDGFSVNVLHDEDRFLEIRSDTGDVLRPDIWKRMRIFIQDGEVRASEW